MQLRLPMDVLKDATTAAKVHIKNAEFDAGGFKSTEFRCGELAKAIDILTALRAALTTEATINHAMEK